MMFVIVLLVICNNEKAYADEKVSYIVKYLDEEGGEISSSVIGYANIQEEIVVTAKEIEGYAARQNEQKIIIDKNNIEIVFNYVKEKTVVVEDKTSEVDNKKVFDLIKKDDVEYEVAENNKVSVRKKVDDKWIELDEYELWTDEYFVK